ncbi:hypothetical protein B0189_02070, partial [Moraxella cuniculi]
EGDEKILIQGNRDKTVDKNDTLSVKQNQKHTISKNKSLTVNQNSNEVVKIAKSVTVGTVYATQVGTVMNTAVGMMQAEEVGIKKTTMVGKSYNITAGDSFALTVGSSSLTLNQDGTIILQGVDIQIIGSTKVDIIGQDVNINPEGAGGASGGDDGNPSTAAPQTNQTSQPNTNQATLGQPLITTGLGADVDKLASQSPSLVKEVNDLKSKGWSFQYGQSGKGSWADENPKSKKIVIDGQYASNPKQVVQTLSHEVGHAKYTVAPDTSSRANYISSYLKDEGAATAMNIKVRDEILSNANINIGVAGRYASQYVNIFNQNGGDNHQTYEAISKIFGTEITSATGQTYNDYYGGYYDRYYTK